MKWFVLAAVLFCAAVAAAQQPSSPTVSGAARAQPSPETVQLIITSANGLCNTIESTKGDASKRSAEVEVGITGLIKKIFGADASLKGNYEGTTFTNLTQEAIAFALRDDQTCRQRVFFKMFSVFYPEAIPPAAVITPLVKNITNLATSFTASANPGDLPLLHDGLSTTHWNSKNWIRAGDPLWVQLLYPGVYVDEVQVEVELGANGFATIVIELEDGSGNITRTMPVDDKSPADDGMPYVGRRTQRNNGENVRFRFGQGVHGVRRLRVLMIDSSAWGAIQEITVFGVSENQ